MASTQSDPSQSTSLSPTAEKPPEWEYIHDGKSYPDEEAAKAAQKAAKDAGLPYRAVDKQRKAPPSNLTSATEAAKAEASQSAEKAREYRAAQDRDALNRSLEKPVTPSSSGGIDLVEVAKKNRERQAARAKALSDQTNKGTK